jgi:holin-like protein
MKRLLLFIFQITGLWLLNELGYYLTEWLHLPIPGNVTGMLLLFFLLVSGIVRLEWIEKASSFLIRHLAFFFIPVAVGLMEFGGLFLENGVAILAAIVGSAAIGILVTGYTSQILEKREKGEKQSHVRDII